MHVAGGFHRAAGLGDHVQAHQAVHAGDADGRQQAADGGGDQRHQQRYQEHQRQDAAGEQGEGLQGRHHQQEDQGQADQQDVQRHLVGGLLALGAFHQGDHPVQGRFAGVGGDLHQQPVGNDAGVAGDGGTVAAGLADHRRRFTGDGRLVDRGDALDHLAVAGNQLAGDHPHHVALAQLAGRHLLVVAGPRQALRQQALGAGPQAVGAGLAAAFGERLGEVGEEHGEPQPQGDLGSHQQRHGVAADEAQHTGEDGGQLDHQHHRRTLQLTRVELDEGLRQRGLPQGGKARRAALFGVPGGAGQCLGRGIHWRRFLRSRGSGDRRPGRAPGWAGSSGRRPAGWSR
ncbi:hypothetical protein D9M68_161740 [compost metagenome]